MEPRNPSVERSAFLNSYLSGESNTSGAGYTGLTKTSTSAPTQSSNENGFFSFASKAGSMFGDIIDASAKVGSASVSSVDTTFVGAGRSTGRSQPSSSNTNSRADNKYDIAQPGVGIGTDFNNLFISWKSESQQEIHGKLLLANKYLATQCESSKAACDELRIKNRNLEEELLQAKAQQKASQKSQELLARLDSMQPLKLVNFPSSIQGDDSNDGDDGYIGSGSLADAFAPTAEDIARKEAAALEAIKREEERAILSAARERQYEIDLKTALRAQKTQVHAEAYAEGVAAAEVLLRAEITKAESRAVEYEKQLTATQLELKTEKNAHRNAIDEMKQELASVSAAAANATAVQHLKNSQSNQATATTAADAEEEKKEISVEDKLLQQRKQELEEMKRKKAEQAEKAKQELEDIQKLMDEAKIKHGETIVKYKSVLLEAQEQTQSDQTSKNARKQKFTDVSSILPSLMIDLQPDSPQFEALMFNTLREAALYKANAENLLSATRTLASSSRTASDAALLVATALNNMQSQLTSQNKKKDNSKSVSSNLMDVSEDGDVASSCSTDSPIMNTADDGEFDESVKLLSKVVVNYGEKQLVAAELLELNMVRPMEDFLSTSMATLSKQSTELDSLRASHLKDLEKYLSNKNKSVDRDNFMKRQQSAMESRKKYELARMDMVSKLRQFQLGKDLATARQLVSLSKSLLPFTPFENVYEEKDGNSFVSKSKDASRNDNNKNSTSTVSKISGSSENDETSDRTGKKSEVVLEKANILNTLLELEALLDSGSVESAVYALDEDWDKRTTAFSDALQEMAILDNLGLDTKQSNEMERKSTSSAASQESSSGVGGAAVVTKKVPARKRSFAAKNREQAMTQGQSRNQGLFGSDLLASSQSAAAAGHRGVYGDNLHLNGIASLINRSTVISEAEGGRGKIDASSVQSGYLWEKSEKGKMDRRKDWGRYYYKLHPKKGLLRIRTLPLMIGQAMDNVSNSNAAETSNGYGKLGLSARQEALMMSPDSNRSRQSLHSLLTPDDGGGNTQRNARSISPRNFRRASTSSTSPRKKREVSGLEVDVSANDSRSRTGRSLERGSGPRSPKFGLNSPSTMSPSSPASTTTSGTFDLFEQEELSKNIDLRMVEEKTSRSMNKTTSFDDSQHNQSLSLDVNAMREKAGSFQEGSGPLLKSPSSSSSFQVAPFMRGGNKSNLFVEESIEVVCNEWALCTVRECDKDDDAVLCFQLISPTLQKPITFQADNEQDFSDWTWAMRDQIQGALDDLKNDSKSPTAKGQKRDENDQWAASGGGQQEEFRNLSSAEISQLLSSNPICADCDQIDPEWVSINLGIVLCITCSGVHRSLGTHVSKVRSLTLDKWSNSRLQIMAQVGNNTSNQFMEGGDDKIKRPSADRSRNEANEWIKNKYVDLKYIDLNKFVDFEIKMKNQSLSSEQKYDIGKGLVESARTGNVSHVLFHLALASYVDRQKKMLKNEESTDEKDKTEYDMNSRYDMNFELTSSVLSAAYSAAEEEREKISDVGDGAVFAAVQEALVLNGYEPNEK